MWLQHGILAFGWVIYCFAHSFFASPVVKTWIGTRLGSAARFYRIAYVLISFAGLVALLWYQLWMPSPVIFHSNIVTQIAGFAVGTTGMIIMLLMIRKYFMQLSGLRNLANNHFKSKLEVSGLHRYVRHPLYLGTFLFIWGLLILLPFLSLFISNLIITVYTIIALRFEEEKLVAEFGEDYMIYRSRVPRLIPKF